jgi:hypothetical protein
MNLLKPQYTTAEASLSLSALHPAVEARKDQVELLRSLPGRTLVEHCRHFEQAGASEVDELRFKFLRKHKGIVLSA